MNKHRLREIEQAVERISNGEPLAGDVAYCSSSASVLCEEVRRLVEALKKVDRNFSRCRECNNCCRYSPIVDTANLAHDAVKDYEESEA